MYKESLFGPLQKKEIDIMDVEQSMINTVFQEDIDGMQNIFWNFYNTVFYTDGEKFHERKGYKS